MSAQERRRRPRTCIGCRRIGDRATMVRLRLDPGDGDRGDRTVAGTVGGGGVGRGAWLCGATSLRCFDDAVKAKALVRAWRRSVSPDTVAALRAWLAGDATGQARGTSHGGR